MKRRKGYPHGCGYPNFFRPPAAEELKDSKAPRVQANKGRLLRNEARHGAVPADGIVEPEGVEPDLAVAEAEDRRAREDAIGIRSELVTSAVGVQLLPADVPLGMNQSHAPDRESSETELAGHEDLTSPTDGTSAMTHAVLSRHDQDVALLLLADLAEGIERPSVLTETVRRDLALPVVVELPGLADPFEHELDGATVAVSGVGHLREVLGGHSVHRRNGEPSFGAVGEFRQGLGEFERVARIETEDLGECLDLVGDRLRTPVLLRVRVARLDFLVGELVGDGVLLDELFQAHLKLTAVFDDALSTILVEAQGIEPVLHEPNDLLALVRRDRFCRHRLPPSVLDLPESLRKTATSA